MTKQETVSGGNRSSAKLANLALTSLFIAIILLLAFVPNLGFINLVVIKATIIHIPVIIGALFLGPKRGALLGGVFGITSVISNTINPSLLSFAFSPIVAYDLSGALGIVKTLFICFVPRILIGVTSYYVFALIMKAGKGKVAPRTAGFAVAGVVGAMTNTILVMGSIFLLYRDAFAKAKDIAVEAVFGAVMGIVGVNGVPEAIVSGVIVTAVCSALVHVRGVKLYGVAKK